jgi:hypothetical protein
MPWSRYTNENMALYNSHAVFYWCCWKADRVARVDEELQFIIYSVLSQSRKESA